VVHLGAHLMETQLDRDGGRILQRKIEAMGMRVLTATTTTKVQATLAFVPSSSATARGSPATWW
jgi:NAD(P)H-nitrite reductase large subunit